MKKEYKNYLRIRGNENFLRYISKYSFNWYACYNFFFTIAYYIYYFFVIKYWVYFLSIFFFNPYILMVIILCFFFLDEIISFISIFFYADEAVERAWREHNKDYDLENMPDTNFFHDDTIIIDFSWFEFVEKDWSEVSIRDKTAFRLWFESLPKSIRKWEAQIEQAITLAVPISFFSLMIYIIWKLWR